MKSSAKAITWTARILCIFAILLVSLFALDSFSSGRTFWQNTAAFAKHLIPSYILLAVLIIAWKREKAGGIILTLAGLVFGILVFDLNFRGHQQSASASLRNVFIVAFPFVLAGILFIISHFKKRRKLPDLQ